MPARKVRLAALLAAIWLRAAPVHSDPRCPETPQGSCEFDSTPACDEMGGRCVVTFVPGRTQCVCRTAPPSGFPELAIAIGVLIAVLLGLFMRRRFRKRV
jgi:hypothetical protein